MAITRLAVSNPSANTDILLYTADRSSLASIIATNKASTVAEVRVWVIPQGQDATPANWSYIAYDADITATNSLETFRFPVMTGDKIYVRSTTADVSFQIMGIYETGADTYVYAQPTQPTAPQIGDIWIDTASDVPSIDNTTVYRWSKTAVGGETSLSGTGNDLSILKYIAGYEQVYLNGVLLAKDLDYFATNGTSITGLLALTAGDIVEVISPYAIELTDVYTKSVSDAKYNNGFRYLSTTYLTSGSGSYTVPTGTRALKIRMVGGGGGGAGSGGGSGAGNGGAGGNGTSSTFGSSLLTAYPGTGGQSASYSPGTGGSGIISSPATGIIIAGTRGAVNGDYNTAAQAYTSGVSGPPSVLGSYGCGGNAANNSATAVCIGTSGGAAGYVEAWITNPLTQYSYVVGTGGSGGAAGTSGGTGFAGGSGLIIIEVYV